MKRYALIVALGCVLIAVFWISHEPPRKPRATAHAQATLRSNTLTQSEGQTAFSMRESSILRTQFNVPNSTAISNELAAQSRLAKTNTAVAAKKEKVFQDPLAREALAMVGTDLDAELYWFDAIHNDALPKSERQDLIDDLNEEGLADPKHPTAEEIPLLLSRLDALEALAPTLTDEFDWHESYDDLLNLVDVAMGGGKPVQ